MFDLLETRKGVQRARYDASASDHDLRQGSATMSPALRAPYRVVEDRVATQAAGRLVLDYGSGQGVYAVGPAEAGARVVGVDISRRSTAKAVDRTRCAGVGDRCRFLLGDCERLPFASGTFDLVQSMGVLSSLEHDRAFAELARVVKPEGTVIVVDTLGHNPLLNLNRRLLYWRGRRTRWELDHIPTLRGLAKARSYFRESRVEFFGVTTPLLAPFCRGEGSFAKWLTRLGESVDRHVLRIGPLRRLAFKFVCTLSGPITRRES
jgi:ubiquinone/menaquinone biosynthesis C-methylase UbiE